MEAKPGLPLMKPNDRLNPLTAPPVPFPKDYTNEQIAAERFAVRGNAIITGGAGVIGLEAAKALLQHGLEGVALFDVSSLDHATAELRTSFPDRKILSRQVDLTDAKAADEATTAAVKDLGSVDILCTFAGIAYHKSCLEMPPEQFRKILEVNTTGSFIMSQAVAKHMVSQGRGGTIVLIGSISGHAVAYPQPQLAYNVSKAAVLHMRASLAAELSQYGIRVNSLSPGYTNTPMLDGCAEEIQTVWKQRNPMGRLGEPRELMGPLVLFCSQIGGSHINGADLIVDGGLCIF